MNKRIIDNRQTAREFGFGAVLAAVALAVVVNAGFGLAMAKASTKGQRIHSAWVRSGGSLYADAAGALHQQCAG